MKNTMKLLETQSLRLCAVALLVAVIGFGMAACNNGTTGGATKFEGRWLEVSVLESGQGVTDYSFTFTGNNWSFSNSGHIVSGTFTFTDTEITFASETFGTSTQAYTITDNRLVLSKSANTSMPYFGAFTKQ